MSAMDLANVNFNMNLFSLCDMQPHKILCVTISILILVIVISISVDDEK